MPRTALEFHPPGSAPLDVATRPVTGVKPESFPVPLDDDQYAALELLLVDLATPALTVSASELLDAYAVVVPDTSTPLHRAHDAWSVLAIEAMARRIDAGETEAEALRAAVAALSELAGPAGALVSSYRIAHAAVQWRSAAQGTAPDADQTRDYVQYLLREAPFVCRHTRGDGLYQIHRDKTCGPSCDRKLVATRSHVQSWRCSCGIEVAPALDECELCQAPRPSDPSDG